jgi:hypothetical protein
MSDKTISLKFVWGIYIKLREEGAKLRAKGDKLWAKGDKLWAEGVLAAYGNVTIEWKSATHCIVDGTDEYTEILLTSTKG